MAGDFFTYLHDVVQDFLTLHAQSSKPVKIVANIDSDGISSAAILSHAFLRNNIPHTISFVKQLTDDVLLSLQEEDNGVVFFADLGSGETQAVIDHLDLPCFILDHHLPDVKEARVNEIRQVNPHLFDINGSKDIAAAGIAYFFAKGLNPQNTDLAHLALVGAIGDMQENMGFAGLNQHILDDAIDKDSVEIRESIRIFGMQTKPIHKVLEYSTNPYIPGVTGSERGAIRFIEEAGVPVYDSMKNFRRLVSLSKQEMERLVTAIELKRNPGDHNEPLMGPVFLLKNADDDSIKKDLREFSTLLNSCGRMGWASLGIAVCMGDSKALRRANEVLHAYHKEILDALHWFYEHRRSDEVIEKHGYTLILAGNHIRDTIIGTLASLLSRSNVYPDGTIIMSTAYTLDGQIKVSTRLAGQNPEREVDLSALIADILEEVGGYGGGHMLAAGASIPQESEDAFVRKALASLEHFSSQAPLELKQP